MKLGRRKIVHTNNSVRVTVPTSYFSQFEAEVIGLDFSMNKDRELIATPIFKDEAITEEAD